MIRFFALLVLPVAVLASCNSPEPQHELWTCPMHPQYVSDKPGNCPICSMKLVPKKSAAAANPSQAAAGSSGAVQIDPEQQRWIGMKKITVAMAPLGGGIRTTGRVTVDERRVQKLTARFDGFVEALQADFTGKLVQKGDPLVAIYSPDVLATEEEYLLAAKSRASLEQSGLPDAARAARDRLRLFGMSDGDIDRLVAAGKPERTVTLRAPISGFITAKSIVTGSKVAPNDALFEIVDLSRLWVIADVYEYELPRLELGLPATLTLSYWPARKWQGKVSYILPTVDEKSRTVKVRIEVANPRLELKPEMFADVVIDTAPRQALVVPDDAVIVTGTRRVVFVAGTTGKLEPRTVETGMHVDGKYEIRAGLRAGDQVAAGASFLLDSEAQLRSAIGGPDGSQP